MSWNDKSNYEINKAVAERFIKEKYIVVNCDSQETVYLCEEASSYAIMPVSHYNPCTNIQDAWPIMEQHNIDIEWPDEGNCCGTVSRYIQGATDVQEDFIDKEEALRCAMIVYLESEGIHPQG